MVRPLTDSLFSALVSGTPGALTAEQRRSISASSEQALGAALAELAPHKVAPLLCFQLRMLGLLETLPEAVRRTLEQHELETRAINAALLLTTASILRAARDRGEPQLLLKGIVLADSYYPDLSTRPMGDVDIVARPGRHLQLYSLLADAGFSPSTEHALQEDGVTYVNPAGMLVDAHSVLRVFSRWPWDEWVRDVELSRLKGVSCLLLEPNAMLAHLAVHMHGHLREMGPVLLWIIDVLFVLRRHREELDAGRVRALCGDDGSWSFLLRVCRLLQQRGEPMPPRLASAVARVPPLSLGFVLRQRRLIPWGIPKPVGWARLLLARASLRDYHEKPVVTLQDVLLWPADELLAWATAWLVRIPA